MNPIQKLAKPVDVPSIAWVRAGMVVGAVVTLSGWAALGGVAYGLTKLAAKI